MINRPFTLSIIIQRTGEDGEIEETWGSEREREKGIIPAHHHDCANYLLFNNLQVKVVQRVLKNKIIIFFL